ncbi:MAG: RlmE family RNA methyltransferase, partial [Desulfobacterales bacterium]|nr:RlmE family RNA methyltransferase [Desulfobacterales bacterium]
PVSMTLPSNARVHVADIFHMDDERWAVVGKNFNVVLSDMAPATTGNRTVDAARSFNLCQAALDTARRVLVPGGALVCKIFQGEDFQTFSDSVKAAFRACRIFKPKSSRKASREIFIIGIGKTGGKNVGS